MHGIEMTRDWQGRILPRGGVESGKSALNTFFVNKRGLLHFQAAALCGQDKMITSKCHCCQMSCQNDLLRMSYCMSDCSGFKISLFHPQNVPDKSKNCLTHTTLVFSIPAYHFPHSSLFDFWKIFK